MVTRDLAKVETAGSSPSIALEKAAGNIEDMGSAVFLYHSAGFVYCKRTRFIYNKGRGKKRAKTNENEVWEVHQMKSARSFKEFEALNGISMEEVLTVFEAVSEAFPMIVAANLTKKYIYHDQG